MIINLFLFFCPCHLLSLYRNQSLGSPWLLLFSPSFPAGPGKPGQPGTPTTLSQPPWLTYRLLRGSFYLHTGDILQHNLAILITKTIRDAQPGGSPGEGSTLAENILADSFLTMDTEQSWHSGYPDPSRYQSQKNEVSIQWYFLKIEKTRYSFMITILLFQDWEYIPPGPSRVVTKLVPYRLRKVGSDGRGECPRHMRPKDRMTRDERTAFNLQLPFSVKAITDSSMEEFGELLNSW